MQWGLEARLAKIPTFYQRYMTMLEKERLPCFTI